MRSFAIIGIVLITFLSCVPKSNITHTIQKELELRGFDMLPNPATVYIPGTLLYADDNKGKWLIACNAEKVLPGIKNDTSSSRTSSLSVNLTNSASLNGNFTMIELGAIVSEYSKQAKVSMEIENPHILQIDHASLQGRKSDLNCLEHLDIKWDQSELGQLSFIIEAYKADIKVHVKFDKQKLLSAEVKNKLLDEISLLLGKGASASLTLKTETNGDSTLTGKELIWGIRVDKKAVTYFLKGIRN